jgi:hypothetical protein
MADIYSILEAFGQSYQLGHAAIDRAWDEWQRNFDSLDGMGKLVGADGAIKTHLKKLY